MKRTILLASSSYDRLSTEPVAQSLTKRGYHVVVYEADKVVTCHDQFSIRISNESEAQIFYNEAFLDPHLIRAAWYRRPSLFGSRKDPLKYASLATEYRELQSHLWNTIPERSWLNSPQAISLANDKLTQLVLAKQAGFTIPETIVSNKWRDIEALPAKTVTLKMSTGKLDTQNQRKIMYATTFKKDIHSLPVHTVPYPGIWQEYIEKAREWRITVVGERIFDAAIYTTKEAKDDWRQKQFSSAVEFKTGQFPNEQKQKCLKLLKRLNLKFGAFDFIEKPNGEIIFLEVNPNGNYGMVEGLLKLPISEAIADELSKIAG